MNPFRSTLVTCLGCVLPGVLLAGQAILHMEIGDPARKLSLIHI